MSSITYDNANSGTVVGSMPTGNPVGSFTIGSNANTYCLVGIGCPNFGSGGPLPSNVYIGGSMMTEINGAATGTGVNAGVWGFANPPTGSQAITADGITNTTYFWTAFTYYNVKQLGNSNNGDATTGTSLTIDLTPYAANSLVWAFGVSKDTSATASFSGPSNNIQGKTFDSNAYQMYSGDYGTQSTQQMFNVSINSGNLTAGLVMVSLAPFPPPATATSASILLRML